MFMMKERKSSKGFTLVELIIVIAIIAVLAVAAVVAYSNISDQARTAALDSDANTVIRALNTYNALSGTPITTLGEAGTLATLRTLSLNKAAHGVDMQLGITITAERLQTIVDEKISYVDGMWIMEPPTGGGGSEEG